MATKKQDSSGMVFLFGAIALLPLLVISVFYYYSLKAKYPEDECSQRVFDVGNLGRPFIMAGIIAVVSWPSVKELLSLGTNSLIHIPILLCALFLLWKVAQSVSSTYFGVLVDPRHDRVLLPKDMANYAITDYFRLKFITEMGAVEQVPLSSIRRITRQGGKQLFIHGKFGSRSMKFSNKQKRDECMSAIQDGGSANVVSEFEGV